MNCILCSLKSELLFHLKHEQNPACPSLLAFALLFLLLLYCAN
uniref:Uncharacterized protein n=1 Tax=Arundo donax TaxID=35708 RepID=A0A0A9BM54_ARUDO